MKNFFTFVFLTFSVLILYGQENNDDYLLKKADSLEATKNYVESLLFLKQLQKTKDKKNYPYYSAKYNLVKGLYEAYHNNYEGAKKEYHDAVQILLKTQQTNKIQQLLSRIYLELTYCYFDWNEALIQNTIGYEYTLKNLPRDTILIDFLSDLGYIQKQLKNYEKSILASEKAAKMILKLKPNDYESLGNVHNNLGIAYSDLHFHNQSLYHYAKSLEYHIKSNKKDKAYVVNSANNTIWESLDYGDEKKAKDILAYLNKNFYTWFKQKEFSKTDGENVKDWNLYFKSIYHLSNLRNEIFDKNYTQAKKHFDTINSIFEKYPKERRKKDNTLMLSRYSYEEVFKSKPLNDEENSKKHIEFNRKTIEIAKSDELKHEELVSRLKLAISYNRYNKFNEALETIEEAKKMDETFFNASRFTIGVLEATVLNSLNKNEDSQKVMLNSYKKLLEKQKSGISLKELKYADFKKFNSSTFIRNIINSATIYFKIYEKSKNKEDLLIANNLYFLASDMFAEFYQKGKYNYSLNKFNQEIASGLLQTQLLINPTDHKKLKEIINRIENNSSQHLWNIFEIKNNQNLKIPAALNRKLNELVFEKNSIKEQIEINSENAEQKNQLAFLEKEIEKTQKDINKIDPSFQKFKSANFSVETSQKKLAKNQMIIKYVVADKQVFAFSIQKEAIQLIELGKVDPLKNAVNEYNRQIKTIDNSYQKTAKILYAKLIQPLIKNKSVSSLIFIPEEFLTTLSFESLQDKSGKLIVQNFSTSYAYSIKLWDILKEKNHANKQNERIVTFAPNYSKIPPKNLTRGLLRADLYDLVDAKKEAKAISELFNGKLFENEAANRDNFLMSTTNFSLHHLAMHSQLEEEYSKSALVFSNNKKVYFDELYQLNFPSKLVVLSACNTGIGTNENGEGLMSLSRALTYSGVKSAVYSLWQVPDKETSEIMITFYENLKKGQAKDEALANAKNTFIDNNPMKKHPFYWAGFVVNGDVSPIMSSNNWMIYLGIGIGILLLLIIFRKKLF